MTKTSSVVKKTGTKTLDSQEKKQSVKSGVTADKYRESIQHNWVKFNTEARCYIEGVYLESGQDVTLSPAAAYRQRKNKNIRPNIEVVWPILTEQQVTDLADGDPRVGVAPKEFNLISQNGGASSGGK